jgi:hypothetical protein
LFISLIIYRTHHLTHIHLILPLSKGQEGEAFELPNKAAVSLNLHPVSTASKDFHLVAFFTEATV